METKSQNPSGQELPSTQTATQSQKKFAAWQQALLNAETKFLAITGNVEKTKIEMGFAAMQIEGNADLQRCVPATIMNAVINVARTGITLNPILRLAYLIPRNSKEGTKCVLDFDYKGLIKILKDNKCCKDVQALIVYEDEEFLESVSQIIPHRHTIKYAKTEEEQGKRKFAGVYCRVLLTDNTVIYTPFMPYWEVLKTEKTSKSKDSQYSPWKTWREEMIKKTKIKRDFKTLISGQPSNELTTTLELEEENHGLADRYKGNLADTFADAEVVEERQNVSNKAVENYTKEQKQDGTLFEKK